ncbi:MAG: zinc ribbon domain-containing protein [Clostridiales bacterium]|nr:zinc ribbon domain-containing protein [Clostridiales bacterium]
MFCPKCGSANDDNSKFCLNCGHALTESTNEQAKPPAPPPPPPAPPPTQPVQGWAPPPAPAAPAPKKKKGCLIALIIVLILFILGGVLSFIGFRFFFNKVVADELANEYNYSQSEDMTQADLDDDDYEGGEFSFSGSWPDDPLLKDVPKPNVGSIFSASSEEDGITIMFSGWDKEAFLDYVKKLKKAGFDKNVEQVDMGFVSSYEADNGKVTVSLAHSVGFYVLTVDKK